MTFTYNGTLDSDLEKVRHLIDDKDERQPLLTDEEIGYHISERGSVLLAAADAAEAVAIQLGRLFDRSALGLSASPGRSADAYYKLSEKLQARALSTSCTISVGGLSVSEKDNLKTSSDAVQPNFEMGQDDRDGPPGEPTNRQVK